MNVKLGKTPASRSTHFVWRARWLANHPWLGCSRKAPRAITLHAATRERNTRARVSDRRQPHTKPRACTRARAHTHAKCVFMSITASHSHSKSALFTAWKRKHAKKVAARGFQRSPGGLLRLSDKIPYTLQYGSPVPTVRQHAHVRTAVHATCM